MATPPRSIRNNNPGNIEAGVGFQGETGTDGRFATFDTPANGIRALFRNFDTYQQQHNLNTVAGMIERHSPAADNAPGNTAAYIRNVSTAMGIRSDQAFDIRDPVLGPAFINAVIRQEAGQNPYTPADVNAGYRGAFGVEPSTVTATTETPSQSTTTAPSPTTPPAPSTTTTPSTTPTPSTTTTPSAPAEPTPAGRPSAFATPETSEPGVIHVDPNDPSIVSGATAGGDQPAATPGQQQSYG